MKIVHSKKDSFKTVQEGLTAAMELEIAKDIDNAIEVYTAIISKYPREEKAHRRLMILYRKKKELKKELTTIKQAIKTFDAWHKENTRVTHGKKVSTLSKSLSKVAGLLDKKGNELYAPEPVAGWLKRMELVEQRIKKKGKKKK